jgi:Prolyl oligopeptidase family
MNSSRIIDIRTLIIVTMSVAFFSDGLFAQSIEPADSASEVVSDRGVLWIGSKPALGGVLTMKSEPMDADLAASGMLRDLGKIAGVLDAKDLGRFRREISEAVKLSDGLQSIGVLQLVRTGETKVLTIAKDPAGLLYLLDEKAPSQGNFLDDKTLDAIGLDRAMLSGIDREQTQEQLRSGRLNLPYFESTTQLDGKTRRARLKRQYPELTRKLDEEQMQLRLPVNQKSKELPGVLVWVSPTPNGQIPRIFYEACDELNLIAIGVDNNGNQRELTNRLQIHLDSIATVQAYFRIDPRRVYITGMSGGGRCSGILQLGFPDVFMGAVPIVGLDTYHRTPTGKAGEAWPERLAKPSGRWFRMLKERRFACITGTMDFNAPEMEKRVAQMQADGLNARLDMIDGMGHTMPSSDQFASAIRWVDELQRELIEEASTKASDQLATILDRYEDDVASDPKARKQLIKITMDAPWSDAAWEAAELLGVSE